MPIPFGCEFGKRAWGEHIFLSKMEEQYWLYIKSVSFIDYTTYTFFSKGDLYKLY